MTGSGCLKKQRSQVNPFSAWLSAEPDSTLQWEAALLFLKKEVKNK
jgi:hypothetical protein